MKQHTQGNFILTIHDSPQPVDDDTKPISGAGEIARLEFRKSKKSKRTVLIIRWYWRPNEQTDHRLCHVLKRSAIMQLGYHKKFKNIDIDALSDKLQAYVDSEYAS